jgi:hypothetical protein
MQTYRPRSADPTKILTRRELATVLADPKRKAPRAHGTRLNLAVFRPPPAASQRNRQVAAG